MELCALLEGLQIARHYHFTPLEINADSTEVISMLHNHSMHYSSLLLECRYFLRQLGSPYIVHIYWEQNRVVDKLAQYEATQEMNEPTTPLHQPPTFLAHDLMEDQTGTDYLRKTRVPEPVTPMYFCLDDHDSGCNSIAPPIDPSNSHITTYYCNRLPNSQHAPCTSSHI